MTNGGPPKSGMFRSSCWPFHELVPVTRGRVVSPGGESITSSAAAGFQSPLKQEAFLRGSEPVAARHVWRVLMRQSMAKHGKPCLQLWLPAIQTI